MAKNKKIILFNKSGCLTLDAMTAYLNKNLDDNDFEKVTLHLENCPLCKDATEGASALTPTAFDNDIQHLRSQIRINYTGMNKVRRMRFLSYTAAAASVLIMVGIFVLYKSLIVPEKENIAFTRPETKASEEIIVNTFTEEPESETVEIRKPERKTESLQVQQAQEYSSNDPDTRHDEVLSDTDTEINEEAEAPEEKSTEVLDATGLSVASPGIIPGGKLTTEDNNLPNQKRRSKTINADYSDEPLGKKEQTDTRSDEFIFKLAEAMPQFKTGGSEEFIKFITDTLKRNEIFIQSGFSDKIQAKFAVDTSGKVVDIYLLNITNERLQQEITNIFKNSPEWTPAIKNGEKVKVTYSILLNTDQ